jgi:CheY-like chemotaxis protein
LEFEGHRVLKASSAEEALSILGSEKVDLATVDVMMPPGPTLEGDTTSNQAGVWLCEKITTEYPKVDLFCLSVINDTKVIRKIEKLGVKFLRKGETPLRTVLNMMRSRLTGIAYSTERNGRYSP